MPQYICPPPCKKVCEGSRGMTAHLSRSQECRDRRTSALEAAMRLRKAQQNVMQASRSPSPESPPFHESPPPSRPQGPEAGDLESVADDAGITEDLYPGAGRIIRVEKGIFEKVKDSSDPNNPYTPFVGNDDWEIAAWVATSGISQKKTNALLKLKPIKKCKLSYGCAKTLRTKLDRLPLLPSGLSWKSIGIVPETKAYPPLEPLILYWREPVDCIAKLLANPRLSLGMDFAPRKVYEDGSKKTRLYNEMATGNWWWRMQDNLPPDEGACVIAVILASDKTHLTTMVGDKEAWPLYLSIGNISQEIRNKASEHAFMLTAYLPIPKFGQHRELEGVLRDWVYHQAVEFVLRQMQYCGEHGIELADADGNVRKCYTFLAAHIADLPEQLLIAIAPHSHSPITCITKQEFGSSKRGQPRSISYVLRLLSKAKRAADPQMQLRKYIDRCKFLGLNGVDKPFWAEHHYADPNLFLTPDHLHQVHKFFRDHILKWVKYVVGAMELDRRLMVLQPMPGFKHWKNGISRIKQWTGREDREIQRTILAVAVGGGKMSPLAVQNLRSALDFIYLSQYTSHSEETLKYLSRALTKFHKTKDEWIRLGGRRGTQGTQGMLRHFNIPKLPSWLNIELSVREMGASLQFTADTPEHGHIEHVKNPHSRSNKKTPMGQMCRDLDHREKVRLKSTYLTWYYPPAAEKDDDEDIVVEHGDTANPKLDQQEMEMCHMPEIFSISIKLAIKPKVSNCLLDTIGAMYKLDDFHLQIEAFYSKSRPNDRRAAFSLKRADVWFQFRLQLATVQEPKQLLPAKTVQAWPPTDDLPYGRCNAVLVQNGADDDMTIQGFSVAQVRCIFKPSNEPVENTLLYVQWFSKPPAVPEPNIDMYVVRRKIKEGRPVGGVIPLNSVARLIQLIPKFGKRLGADFDYNNVLDIGKDYYINSFFDKEIYQAVY